MIYEPSININEEAIFTKSKKNPVFIVLSSGNSLFASLIKKATNSEISHAMISFNSKLDPLYSFGTRPDGRLGFVINNPKARVWDKEDCKYSVYVMYVTDKAKHAMQTRLADFVDNEKSLKYSFKGVLNIFRGRESEDDDKWFCSRFVMEIISEAQPLSKVPSLWRPSDISSLENISLVNRGFNFYNYNPKVTERHCKDIKDGNYHPGDVIYEGNSDPYVNYLTTGSELFLDDYYKKYYSTQYYKIPEVGYPDNSKDEYEAMKEAAIKAANKYYKFKPSDANRNYPFKFFNLLEISKNEYMSIINNNVSFSHRFNTNLYQCNFTDKKKRISVVLLAEPGHIYAMYLLLPNNVLYKFNYDGLLYQESAVQEADNNYATLDCAEKKGLGTQKYSIVDIDMMMESSINELSSSVEKDFQSKKDTNLSQYTKVRLTDAIIQVYQYSNSSLKHIRITKDTKGYIWLDDNKKVVGYINVEEKDDDYKWIQAFEIYEPYKGHGLSKQMLKIAVTELGATNLSVSKDNELAIKIYKSFGFKTYKSTDSMYFMSRDKNIEEAYYTKDPISGAYLKTSFTDNDYRITAELAQKQIRKLHSEGKFEFVTCTDIELSGGLLTYAEYKIDEESQIESLRKFVNLMNAIVNTSQYCGVFLFPEHISKGATGLLKLRIDAKYVSEEKSIDEKQIKSYKNPAMQLRIKNTKKKNDQISKGNYVGATPSIPQPKTNKKS